MQEVGKLLANVESTRAELAPRKKFAFRSKRNQGSGVKARERQTHAVSSPASAATGESGGIGEIGTVKMWHGCQLAYLLLARARALCCSLLPSKPRFSFQCSILHIAAFNFRFSKFFFFFGVFSFETVPQYPRHSFRGTRWKLPRNYPAGLVVRVCPYELHPGIYHQEYHPCCTVFLCPTTFFCHVSRAQPFLQASSPGLAAAATHQRAMCTHPNADAYSCASAEVR